MEPFALSQKLEDLNVVLYQAAQKYPKSEKFTLAKETTMCGIRAALFVSRGNKVHGYSEKMRCMNQADTEVGQLKILLRLALRLEVNGCPFLSEKKYGQLAVLVDEVGRMIGGWIKSATQSGRG